MTEYDYSPEAWERYLATQDRIARWVDGTRKQQPCNAFTPATPHVKALALKEKERQRQKASGRAYNGKFTDESEDEYCEPRRRSHRKPSRQHRTYWDDVGKDFVFVDAHDVPPPSPPPSRCRRSSFSIPVSPTSPAKSNGKPRKGPRNLTLDLAPFPTCGVPPQDPYSYRNSGHSSHSSNTTTPTTTTPTSSMFPAHQLPVPPYSAPPAMGYAPMLGGGGLPMRPERAPKPTRTQTMPVSPHYANPQAHYVHHGFMPIPVGHNTLMVPLSPGMKGYPSYGADPSKSQKSWADYRSPPVSPSSTKPPSLLRRVFTSLTSPKTPSTPPPPYYHPQYPQMTPQHQSQMFPSKPKPLKNKEPMMFLGGGGGSGGSKRMARKRSISF